MNKTLKLTAAVTLITLVVSSSAFAETRPRHDTNGRSDSRVITVEGRIRDLDRDRNGIVIRLDRGGYALFASRDTDVYSRTQRGRSDLRQLERGDHIRATGRVGSRGTLRVDRITLVREEDDRRDGDDRILRGVVQSVDHSRRTVWLRADRSSRVVEVDLRGAQSLDRHSRVQRGDRMTVSGDWRSNGRFEAERYTVNEGGRL